MVKALLWVAGGYKIIIAGSEVIANKIKEAYTHGGLRDFDVVTMEKIYEKTIEVQNCSLKDAPKDKSSAAPVGRHLDGCRMGFDAGIELDESLSPAEKLKVVQKLMEAGDQRAADIYDTIGAYFGYAIAFYTEFYDIKHVLIMGRVTSGEGGSILLARAQEVLDTEFPELAKKIQLHIPDESSRRVGQSVAAASLPEIR